MLDRRIVVGAMILMSLAVCIYMFMASDAAAPLVEQDEPVALSPREPELTGLPGAVGASTTLPTTPEKKGCALVVRVQMPTGEPLDGFGIRIREIRNGKHTWTSLGEATSDRRGEARFEGLPEGDVLCEVGFIRETVAKTVTLVEGASNSVTLECVSERVLVTGTFLRGDVPIAHRDGVICGRRESGKGLWLNFMTNETGEYRCLVPYGSFEMRSCGDDCDAQLGRWNYRWWQRGGSGPWAYREPLSVDGSVRIIRFDVLLPETEIRSRVVRAGSGEVLDHLDEARIIVDRAIPQADEASGSKMVDEHGVVLFRDLPFDTISVRATCPKHVDSLPQRVTLSEASPRARLRFELAPSARVALTLRDAKGRVVHFGRVGRPVVRDLASGRVFAGSLPPSKGRTRKSPLMFENVPASRLVVTLQDVRLGDSRTYNLYGPPQRRELNLKAGDNANVIMEGVVKRAPVQLLVTDAKRKPDPSASIEVSDALGVRMGQSRWTNPEGKQLPHQWLGFLVPGRYSIRLTNGDRHSWSESMDVASEVATRVFSSR